MMASAPPLSSGAFLFASLFARPWGVPMSTNAFESVPMVSRIVDYEPPAVGGPPVLPPVTELEHRRAPAALPPPTLSAETLKQMRAAATFADAALRRVLEVIDRRRPLTQLRPLMAAGLVETLLSGAGRHGDVGVARLLRVRAQLSGPDGDAAEVSAHYTRGDRVHAIACRVQQVSTPTGPRWQVVALHLG